jgi:hypothetical protein
MLTPAPPSRAAVLALSLFTLAPIVAGCDLVTADFKSKETAEWRKTYQLAAGGRVEISNVNGRIEVSPSSDNTVEIVALKTARGATPEVAKTALDRIEIQEDASAAGIRIQTKVARSNGFLHGGGSEVRYTVKVPAAAAVKFTTVNGGVELQGLTGRIVAEATNGGIRARDVGGPIEASTTNGGIDVQLARVAEPGVKLGCTNGGIKLRLPSDAQATVSANVANGGIELTGGEDMSFEAGEKSRRRLEGRLNGGGPGIRLDCTNGGIQISSNTARNLK